jgi:lipoyl-dependent peroxiredoxin
MIRKASAKWTGDLKTGIGHLTSQSGTLNDTPFSFHTRFEDGVGTNPEELLGAALAGCYSMALNNNMRLAGHSVEHVETHAALTMEKVDEKLTISTIHLEVQASVNGMDENTFNDFLEKTREGCIVRRALTSNVTVSGRLQQA